MSTDECREVLHRDFSRRSAEAAIAVSDPLLTEIVNHASCAFLRCLREVGKEKDVYIAPFWLYRHIMEQVDGIGVLLKEACVVAAQPLLRVAFEATLGFEYIHENREHFAQRSLAWLCGHLRSKSETLQRLDPRTTAGAAFKTAWNQQELGPYEIPFELVDKQRMELQRLLAADHLQPIFAELQPRKKWHEAFGGPRNLRALAVHLNRAAEYDLFYRYWSSIVHGGDADLYLVRILEGGGGFRIVRDPTGLQKVASLATNLLLRSTRLMIGFYREGENLSAWYRDQIQSAWTKLLQIEVQIDYRYGGPR